MSRAKSSTRQYPTAQDVANAAGVSTTTVSHIFNKTPGRPINAATRERVLKAARDLGYVPNTAARALSRGRSDEIWLLSYVGVHDYIASQIAAGVQRRTYELGYSLGAMPHYAQIPQEEQHALFESVLARRPAGIIGVGRFFTPATYRHMRHQGIRACAVIHNEPLKHVPTIVLPLEQAGYIAGRHLLERGHRHIGYLVPDVPNPPDVVVNDGLRGLQSALADSGATLTPIPYSWSTSNGDSAVMAMQSASEPITAVYYFEDEHGFTFLRALLAHGLAVPRDVALLGAMGNRLSALFYPSLTTVRIDLEKVGAQLVDIVDALVREKKPAPEWLQAPPPQLIVREST